MLQRVSTQKSSPIGRIGAELELSETLNSQIFKLLNFQNFFKLSSIPRRHLQIFKYLSNITKDFSIFILRWPPSGLLQILFSYKYGLKTIRCLSTLCIWPKWQLQNIGIWNEDKNVYQNIFFHFFNYVCASRTLIECKQTFMNLFVDSSVWWEFLGRP